MINLQIQIGSNLYNADLQKPMCLSVTMQSGSHNPNAFHIPHPRFEPIKVGDFIGSVAAGSGANCENLFLNAHGNGTHTECIGHITLERISIHESLNSFHFAAQIVSMNSSKQSNGDHILQGENLEGKLHAGINALIIRSLPNSEEKRNKVYSGSNPVYFEPALCEMLAMAGIEHLLTDLPSVDREEDGGAMAAHKAFWQYPHSPRKQATITEMIFVPDSIPDGLYLLQIQIAPLATDASPSNIIIYPLSATTNIDGGDFLYES